MKNLDANTRSDVEFTILAAKRMIDGAILQFAIKSEQ